MLASRPNSAQSEAHSRAPSTFIEGICMIRSPAPSSPARHPSALQAPAQAPPERFPRSPVAPSPPRAGMLPPQRPRPPHRRPPHAAAASGASPAAAVSARSMPDRPSSRRARRRRRRRPAGPDARIPAVTLREGGSEEFHGVAMFGIFDGVGTHSGWMFAQNGGAREDRREARGRVTMACAWA